MIFANEIHRLGMKCSDHEDAAIKAQREWVSVEERWPDDDSDAPYVWVADEGTQILIGEVWRMKAYHEHWPVSH